MNSGLPNKALETAALKSRASSNHFGAAAQRQRDS
jgi:hypothetical protein